LEAQLLDRINGLVGPGRITSVKATVARRLGLWRPLPGAWPINRFGAGQGHRGGRLVGSW